MIEKDLGGGLKLLSDIGYREIQLYGPYSFYTEKSWQFWNEVVSQSLGYKGCGLFGKTPKEFSQLLVENNLAAKSLHSDLENLEVNMPKYGELADVIGIEYVVMPMIKSDQRQTLDDFKRMADRFNKVGESARKEGLTFTYHNHGPGWVEMEGEIPAKYIMDNTDPDLVKLEMDIYWIIAAGEDPIEHFKAYPNRFVSLHLADMKELKLFSGDGSTMDEVMELFPNVAPPGSGQLNIKEITSAASQAGVELFYLEQIPGLDEEEMLRRSYQYLSSI